MPLRRIVKPMELATILFVLALTSAVTPTQTVGEIVPGSPAASALKPGDEVLAIDGRTFFFRNTATSYYGFSPPTWVDASTLNSIRFYARSRIVCAFDCLIRRCVSTMPTP